MILELHYLGGAEPIFIEEVHSYAPLDQWFVIYLEDGAISLLPVAHLDHVWVRAPEEDEE